MKFAGVIKIHSHMTRMMKSTILSIYQGIPGKRHIQKTYFNQTVSILRTYFLLTNVLC